MLLLFGGAGGMPFGGGILLGGGGILLGGGGILFGGGGILLLPLPLPFFGGGVGG